MHTITGTEQVRAALTDPGLTMPPVPQASRGIAWLRAGVARFSAGEQHERRRRLAVDALATVDPAALGRRARERAGSDPHDLLAVEVLAEALGIAVPAGAVATVARGYHPHLPAGPDTDAAVARLVEACGGVWDEATAARIGLLVQACDATAEAKSQALGSSNGSPRRCSWWKCATLSPESVIACPPRFRTRWPPRAPGRDRRAARRRTAAC
ncbi:hypothetical protein [Actinophytocola sp.]|uniref:hypothetical protein n=1 Tax=Actinophytocola sp. TaxID=1872138 RepID=UPI002D7ECD80|nr:hypothetical protein [Actinophytocola sp.]HET9141574.1 hypothetical protein [Actinophytocola sp.]